MTSTLVRSPAQPRGRLGRDARSGWGGGPPSGPRPGDQGRRILALMIGLLLVTAAITARLVQIQYLEPDRYVALGDAQRDGVRLLPAARGSILDRDGQVLAVSIDRPTLWIDPRQMPDADAYADVLAPLLGLNRLDLLARLRAGVRGEKAFLYLARQVEPEVADAVLALELPGIASYDEPWRSYPAGEVGRAVLGSVNPDHVGSSGLEELADAQLEGEAGAMHFERAEGGEIIPAGRISVEPAVPGQDLVLTLDREMQWLTEEVLKRTVVEKNAARAMALVMATDTGEVLALASVDNTEDGPRPSSYARELVDVFEPGSVAKVFTISAALEEGIVTPDTHFEVDPGIQVYDAEITDEFAAGVRDLSVTQIVQESSNVGTVQVAQRLGADLLDEYLLRFGFDQRTGVGGTAIFPGEATGLLPDREDWSGTSLATIAYGQGISVTGLQMAAAYNAIANDGVYVTPSLIRSDSPSPERRVISSQTAQRMRSILTGVVHAGGTGSRAKVPGYLVAGKTGTARKPDTVNGGYLLGTWDSTFAGFAPADDPVITVVVVVDDPKPEYYGGLVAAPLFSELAGYALRTLRVPPTDPGLIEAVESGEASGAGGG